MTNFILLTVLILIFIFIIGEGQRNNPCHRLANYPEQCNSDKHPKGM